MKFIWNDYSRLNGSCFPYSVNFTLDFIMEMTSFKEMLKRSRRFNASLKVHGDGARINDEMICNHIMIGGDMEHDYDNFYSKILPSNDCLTFMNETLFNSKA